MQNIEFNAPAFVIPPPPPPNPIPPPNANPGNPPADPNQPPPLNQHQILARNHRAVITTPRGRSIFVITYWLVVRYKISWLHEVYSAISTASVTCTVLLVLTATIAPWFHVVNESTYYCQNQFLWLFLLPPLSCVPLMFSSVACVGRLCWLHCWTVTIISVGMC